MISLFATSVVAVALLAEAVALLYRFGTIGAGVALGIVLWQYVAVASPSIALGTINVTLADTVFVCLALAAGLRLLRLHWHLRGPTFAGLVLLVGLFLLSFARGIFANGVEAAGNDFRGFFYFVAGTLYVASQPFSPKAWTRLLRLWVIAGVGLLVVAGVRWFMVAEGTASNETWWTSAMTVGGTHMRVIEAAPALLLAQVFLVGCFAARGEVGLPRSWWLLAFVIFPVLIGLQQRTVWVVILACALLMVILARRLRGPLLLVLGGGVLLGSLLVLASFGTGIGSVGKSLEGSALEALGTQRSTILWRVEGWEALLGDARISSPLEFFVGLPLGSGYLRTVFGSQVGVTPHNFYIAIFLRTGLAGLFAFVLMYLGCLWPLLAAGRQGERRGLWCQLAFVLLSSQLLYFLAYGASFEQGLLLGIAMALASLVPERQGAEHPVLEVSVGLGEVASRILNEPQE